MTQQFVYVVRPGFTHGAQKEFKAGDEVIMTAVEAQGFLDKLRLVGPAPVAGDAATGDDGDAATGDDGDAATGDDGDPVDPATGEPKPAAKKRK